MVYGTTISSKFNEMLIEFCAVICIGLVQNLPLEFICCNTFHIKCIHIYVRYLISAYHLKTWPLWSPSIATGGRVTQS